MVRLTLGKPGPLIILLEKKDAFVFGVDGGLHLESLLCFSGVVSEVQHTRDLYISVNVFSL